MTDFQIALNSWQVFYATVAAATATLTGLLFVSLSINRDRLRGPKSAYLRETARQTFGDFLYLVMMAFVFLVPHETPISLMVALMVLGLTRGIGLLNILRKLRSERSPKADRTIFLRDIGLSAVAAAGLIVVAVFVALGFPIAIYGLVFVVAALLISACWSAWILLVD